MGIESWILLVWLFVQFTGKCMRIKETPVASALGCAAWLAMMIYMISLSGGWK